METHVISNLDFSRIKERVYISKGLNSKNSEELEQMIARFENAKILEPSEIPEDVITMNSKVMIRDLNHNKTYTIQIVYPEDADRHKNRISVFSSLARLLLGRRVGDIVNWNSGNGNIGIKIEYILYQPEACGDFHL